MIIRVQKDDGITPFERHFLLQEASEELSEKRIRRFKIPLSVAERYFTEADDVAVDTSDQEDEEDDVSVDKSGEDQDDGNDVATDDTNDEDEKENDDNEDDTPTDDTKEDDSDEDGDDVATDDTNDEDEKENDDADSDDNEDENEGKGGNGEKGKDIIHKQNLYKRFMNIHDSINHYIEKLDNTVGINEECNRDYKAINDRFKSLRDFIYHYMILKFSDASYGQSMLFYQRSVGAVQLAMELLEVTKRKELALRMDK